MDIYSKAKLFNEKELKLPDTKNLKNAISNVESLINNQKYNYIINQVLGVNKLKELSVALHTELRKLKKEASLAQLTNNITEIIQKKLTTKSSTPSVKRTNLYDIAKDIQRVKRFNTLVNGMKKEKKIKTIKLQNFYKRSIRKPFKGAQEIKSLAKSKDKFSEAFNKYDDPYAYLCALKEIPSINVTDLHKFFVKIDHSIVNYSGQKISGGQRTEFIFLQKIQNALDYDYLIIDEPEGSFDNIFLKESINQYIQDVSNKITVIMTTHNSTLGTSINPDYLIYCTKNNENDFDVFYGYPNDEFLKNKNNITVSNKQAQLDCAHFLDLNKDEYRNITEITSNDIYKLLEVILESNVTMDNYEDKKIDNPAEEIIYSNIYNQFKEIIEDKTNIIDSINEEYKLAEEKYK